MRGDTQFQSSGTDTREGFIPHAHMTLGGIAIDAPVRVLPNLRGAYGAPFPERTNDGRLVYALPGGGRVAR